MKKREYLPTQRSIAACFLISVLIILIYLIDTPSIAALMNNFIFSYVLKPALWLLVILLVWKLPKVHQKAKLRYNSFLLWWSFYFAFIYLAVFVAAGFVEGFGKSPYGHSITGILLNVLLVGSAIAGREIARSYVVSSLSKDENYLVFILISIFMAVMNIQLSSFFTLKSFKDIVIFMAQYFVPELGKSLFATYLVFLGGALPSIIYLGVIEAANWLSPIIPNLNWITTCLFGTMCPIFSFLILQNMYAKESRQRRRERGEKENLPVWIVTALFSIGTVWFLVGVFPIFPSVIATGSMEPMIKPGDVVLVKKDISINKLNVGDIIQFKDDNILISHRIVEKVEVNGKECFKTKGDNNTIADDKLVKPENIKGTVVKVIPKVGWPTLLLKGRNDVPLKKVQF